MKNAMIIGCGLSGAVVARELAENGYKVKILEKRNHIGGNMYDHVDEFGILIQDYGPHTFHTKKKALFDYICKYEDWTEYQLTCGAEINGICTHTPFNYDTIDAFYSEEEAEKLKEAIKETFSGRKTASVVEVLNCGNKIVEGYAQFLFDNDYSLYSAKQWGVSPSEIDPSILERVPIRFNYDIGYFDDEYQVMPKTSFTHFFENILKHENIDVCLNIDALDKLEIKNNCLWYNQDVVEYPVIYTGPLDELFQCCYGELPYRSLRFERKHDDRDSFQNMPVVAYPQAPDYVRIIEYKKLPIQEVKGTTYEIEYSLPYKLGEKNEPYYPLLTKESQDRYSKYESDACNIKNLFVCGRLGQYKYLNMDQALEIALTTAQNVINTY